MDPFLTFSMRGIEPFDISDIGILVVNQMCSYLIFLANKRTWLIGEIDVASFL